MNMDKRIDTQAEKQDSAEKKVQSKEKDNLIVAIFKILLGFNYLKMGTKKNF